MAAPKKARFKQMIRTISKGQHYDYDAGLMTNEEVEQEINKYLPEWEVKYVDCLDREAPFGELNNAGVEMLYVLVLKE